MSGDRLVDGYALVVFDLDGVIYLIDQPIPGAVETVARLHGEGRAVAYATNNASRRAADVADLLTGMGVPARPEEVLTSAAAAAQLLGERLPAGAKVLVVGAEALRAEISEAGLAGRHRRRGPGRGHPGYGPQVGWADLAEAAVAVRAGATWVATNTDRTLPSGRGPLPGNGALVAALATALGRDPDEIVGKPAPELFATAARRADGGRTVVVGDRLDTDIEGANRAGLDSLLVLTGVSDAAELLAAPAERRPTYVSWDLTGLFDADGVVRVPAPDADHGGWQVSTGTDEWRLSGSGRALDALAALCAAAWRGHRAGPVRPASPAAGQALERLGLVS
ncbi:HAD-IIA family hydrolase [Verrucosispora sioxanthis]|uniref:HAD-IIA family hydrolase n=1 Tax=Verrucosispora sioxanthis TaxID=2499994 RepID=UPI00140E4800|nr:HAD hydrolase-like protein [Verrucosispora sioxanthis]